ncbi:MAG: hypothetical protein AAB969_01520 [Patescibacteria group bacterium]
MFKLITIDDYNFIPIQKRWFKGRIYVDKRTQIFPFQMAILDKFISEIVAKSSQAKKIKLDFHIMITGDTRGIEYSVDVFAFVDEIVIDNQNIFNNAFSAIHWALSDILSTISQLYEGLLSRIPIEDFDGEGVIIDDDYEELLPGELEEEKKETIH